MVVFFYDYIGAVDYSSYIREPHVSFIDILNVFPSCKPPFHRLLGKLNTFSVYIPYTIKV